MITVGSRDERKRLSLRYDIAGGNMGITAEFEEGEACFQSNYDDDSTIDPDISLSYIDEKIQNVLGHCRKDFEGGFTAENLGAKFGGYGSFLPTYQRSPIGPHPKTPSQVVTYSAPVLSPNSVHIEAGHQNSASQSSVSQPARKGSSNNGVLKQEISTSCGDKSTSKGDQSVNNLMKDSDQKSLKVRIKVGSDNLATRKKAEIYSGLGLDISPSSSMEASPVDSNGFFHMPPDDQNVSPTSILEMMTSFPVMGSLVSPLPYDVLHLMEKEKGSQESSVTALHGSDFSKVDQDVVGDLSDIAKEESTKPVLPIKTTYDEKNLVLPIKTDSDVSIGSKIVDSGAIKPLKQKDGQKAMKLAPIKTSSSSGSKRKSKGLAMDNGLKNESFTCKSKNNEDDKKKSGKVKDTYKDFFGEVDLGQEDDGEMGLEKPPSGGNNGIIGKKSQPSSSVYTTGVGSHVATMGNGLGSDAGATMVAPVVNEDWVCCDKCEKWRLLPPGVNPSSLPEKWLCSMLDWLPGMNRCSISEEETTKAITSRFPGPSVQGSQPVHPDGNGTHKHTGSQIPVASIKKKHGLKDVSNEAKQDKPSMSSNSSKKNLNTSYKSRSLNAPNRSPLNGMEFQDSGQSRRMIVEKDRQNQKDNNNPRQNFLDEGNNNHHSKISNKRESTQDFPKDCKKAKTDSDDGTFHMGKFDKRDIGKKRKRANEVEGTPKYVKETSETNYRKEKKPKVLKSEDEGITTKKGKNIEDVKMRSINVIDSSRKDTVMAATSSSSKVSGSQRTKTNNQEPKGSPVGSVSSAPLRNPNNNNNNKGFKPLKKIPNIRTHEEKSKEGRNKSQGKFASENAKTHGQPKHRHHDDHHDSKKVAVGKEKSKSLPPRGQSEKEQAVHRKENAGNNSSLKHNKKAQNIMNVKDSSPNTHKGKEHDPTVVLVRDLSNQATTNALREATNLKHMADRVKNGGSSLESRALYMQAALKFLHVASVFESCHKETGRYGDMIQSNSIYSSTAKLCEYCAHEYERTNEMATAALAYKCMEVAYMKVIYSSHTTASKDANELQSSLQMGPTGESPSSSASASDIDNLNYQAKCVNTPQVAGNHIIAATHKPNFTRILNFAQDVNSAMEASRKSRIAFESSSSKQEGCSSAIKTALDFNFYDVEGLLHRVRLAMEKKDGCHFLTARAKSFS
ncbi:hypothetical protein L1887_21230 [Cichorium endivia]|nr:hypothetical protein L1887_21230 [Cichorium endivia]